MSSRDLVLYSRDDYAIIRGGSEITTSYFHLAREEFLRCFPRRGGYEYMLSSSEDKNSKNSSFLELAGEIMYLMPQMPTFRYPPRLLYSADFGMSCVRVIYDGFTTLTIEDSEYIYTLTIEGYAKLDVASKEGVFLITYTYDGYEFLKIIVKNQDYEQLLSVFGDNITIGDNNICVDRTYHDSLGRIAHREYMYTDGEYKCINTQFEYTYSIHYRKELRCALFEDALVAEDYDYIANNMACDVRSEDIASYFRDIEGKGLETLSIEPLDVSHAYLLDKVNGLMDISIVSNDDGRILNFDRGMDEQNI